jgi:hypothetical protein
VAHERFEKQKKLLSKHGRTLAGECLSILQMWIACNSITYTRVPQLVSHINYGGTSAFRSAPAIGLLFGVLSLTSRSARQVSIDCEEVANTIEECSAN